MTTQTTTLTDFLGRRLAEDEAAARGIQNEGAGWNDEFHRGDMSGPTRDDEYSALVIGAARVLAEVEAKRRIVERETERLREQWRRRMDEHRQTFDEWLKPPYGETLRDLASVYADHPEFDEAWRP